MDFLESYSGSQKLKKNGDYNLNVSNMFNLGNIISDFPLTNFFEENHQKAEYHIPEKKGDIPLEMMESEESKINEDFSPKLYKEANVKNILNYNVSSSNVVDKFNKLELFWEHLSIKARIKTKKHIFFSEISEKTIINDVTGIIKPGSFTAILGPSGCGKTTLLNFLSGRMLSKNLTCSGILKINGQSIDNIEQISNQIAYVMQDDILLATLTPRESFLFTAALRLNLTGKERIAKVDDLLKELGLQQCANTKIGNNLIRGISGGERKRTSIGVELLTNPSMIFLDEPTTGLDSATSFNVVDILKKISVSGRTVISTIHQPSSEIFGTFDKLMLLVKGDIIYQGDADKCLDYFAQMGLKAPPFSNPSTFLMKCMNPEGFLVETMQKTNNFDVQYTDEMKTQFQIRIDKTTKEYKESSLFKAIKPELLTELPHDKELNKVTWMTEFVLIMKRGFNNELRNPMDVRTRFFTTVFMAIFIIIAFIGLGEYRAGIQNRNGAIFLLTLASAFAPVVHAILIFAADKPLFLREVSNKTYCVSAYYWGRTTCEFPFQVSYPFIQVCIVYYAIGLNNDPERFFICILICVINFFTGVSFGVFVSVLLPKAEIAMALVPLVVTPFMLFGGFFVVQSMVPYYFLPIQYISPFRYAYQALVMNEFEGTTYFCDEKEIKICDPIKDAGFQQTKWESIIILFAIGIAFRLFGWIVMECIGKPKRPKLNTIN